jgi:hypothetical protein
MNDYPFFYSSPDAESFPLELYLPKYRAGLIPAWLDHHISSRSLILTPFSNSPQAILDAAKAGYRLIVPAHNPILRLLIESMAKPAPKEKLNTALVHLASSTKSGERIKPLVLSLYKTICPQCGGDAFARSFIWSRDQNEPISKICQCRTCGEDTEGDVDSSDITEAKKYSQSSPSHARALTRVSAPDNPIRLQVEIALRSYPARSVYALFTLYNKISGLEKGSTEKRFLELLLLYAFYRSSSPITRISVENDQESELSDRYIEENVWFCMEDAINVWGRENDEVALDYWPELPPETGGICIFPDRIRELIPLLTNLPIDTALFSFPKPTLSFWALSALWTGWLWGQEAAAPLRSILSIKDHDWSWLSRAVVLTLSELNDQLSGGVQFLGSLPELDPEYLITSFSSACQAGLNPQNLTIESELKYGLSKWQSRTSDLSKESSQSKREIIRKAGIEYLKKVGEPAHTLNIYGAGLMELNQEGLISKNELIEDQDLFLSQIKIDFEENIAYRQGFLHFENIGNWWHQDLSLSSLPHSDQVEITLVKLLINHSGPLTEKEIYHHIYQAFPGLLTPRESYIQALLESYGENTNEDPCQWMLKPSDQPKNRKNDLNDIKSILTNMGRELGFSVVFKEVADNIIHLIWGTEITQHYNFFISVSGLLHKIINRYSSPPINSWIVLPGSRAGLIHHKIQRNPILDKKITDQYHFLKFRHVRRLEEQGGLTHTNIQEQLGLDPFTTGSPQLPLI